jgi:hypothetical protein
MKQLKKQNSTIGGLIPSLPKSEVKIYDAYKTQMRICDYNKNSQMDELVKGLGQWAYFLGLTEKTSDKDLVVLAEFIKEYFGTLNIVDISEAIKFSIESEECKKVENFGVLSPIYVSKILHLYKAKRSRIIVDTNAKITKLKGSDVPPPTKAERLENMRFILHDAWEKVHAQKDTYQDFGDVLYDFIRKYDLIKFTKKLIAEAQDYARLKIVEENRASAIQRAGTHMAFLKKDKETEKRKKSREYVVNQWIKTFKKTQMDEFINKLESV